MAKGIGWGSSLTMLRRTRPRMGFPRTPGPPRPQPIKTRCSGPGAFRASANRVRPLGRPLPPLPASVPSPPPAPGGCCVGVSDSVRVRAVLCLGSVLDRVPVSASVVCMCVCVCVWKSIDYARHTALLCRGCTHSLAQPPPHTPPCSTFACFFDPRHLGTVAVLRALWFIQTLGRYNPLPFA